MVNVPREYKSSLNNFWSGRPHTAIENLSKLLADRPDRSDQFFLYRLWIEILADQKDDKSLRSLLEHLEKRTSVMPELRNSYMALRGLIHFELDEIDAAKLFADSLRAVRGDNYCLEFVFLVNQRLYDKKAITVFHKKVDQLEDYFHLMTVARFYLDSGDSESLERIYKRTHKLYSNAPLENNFKLHLSLGRDDFASAGQHACDLVERFPAQMEYRIFAAYSKIMLGESEKAVEILEAAMPLGVEEDVDGSALLGACYTGLYQELSDETYRQKSEHFLTRAKLMLEEVGLSAVYPSYHETILAGASRTDEETTMVEQKVWISKLSSAVYHQIRTMKEEQLNHITRPLGEEVKPGDVVFFVGDDYRNASSEEKYWRIGAVYTVASEPVWNPMLGFECSLELLERPSLAVPIDVHFIDEASKNDGAKDTVFSVSLDALTKIEETIREYATDSTVGCDRVLDEIGRARMTS